MENIIFLMFSGKRRRKINIYFQIESVKLITQLLKRKTKNTLLIITVILHCMGRKILNHADGLVRRRSKMSGRTLINMCYPSCM